MSRGKKKNVTGIANPFSTDRVQEVMTSFLESNKHEQTTSLIESIDPVVRKWLKYTAGRLKLNYWTFLNSYVV